MLIFVFLSLRLCSLSSLQDTALMVLAVGNHDDCLSYVLLRGKAVGCQLKRTCYVCSLRAYQVRLYLVQEHLCRHVICRYRQLYEGVTGKDYQAYLV